MFPNQVLAMPTAPISAKRVVTRNGVYLDGLAYNCPRLQGVAGGRTVTLLAFAHDVGYVVVEDPWARIAFEVPAVDRAYAAGMRRDVHRLNMAIARRLYCGGPRRVHLRSLKLHVEALVSVARAGQHLRRACTSSDQHAAFNARLRKASDRLDK